MFKYILTIALGALVYFTYTNLPVKHGPGVLADSKPSIKLLRWQKPFSVKNAKAHPKKEIEGEVRILRKKTYYFDDLKEYAPIDILVGWKELSDETILNEFHTEITNREYEFDITVPPMPVTDLHKMTDLWHLVPSSEAVAKQMSDLREGHVIKLKGLLIDLTKDDKKILTSPADIESVQRYNSYTIWVEEIAISTAGKADS